MKNSGSTDILQRFRFEDMPVHGAMVRLGATWRAVLERHQFPAPVHQLLGQMAAAAVLLSATLRYQGSLSLQIQSSGPLTLAIVECTSTHTLRATARWNDAISASSLPEMARDGRLIITLDPGRGQHRFQGIAALEAETMAGVIEDHLLRSEGLATRLWLAVDEDLAVGLLLQRLPERKETDPESWNRAVLLAQTITDEELLALPAPAVLRRLFHEEDLRLFDGEPVSFRCSCSRDKVIATLRALGPDEIWPLFEEQGTISVDCEFCNQRYRFDRVDIEQLFAAALVDSPSSTQH